MVFVGNKYFFQMAQECGSAGTPLPVVGCEVEFTPDQHYKIMRSGNKQIVVPPTWRWYV